MQIYEDASNFSKMAVFDALGLGWFSGAYVVQSDLWLDNNEDISQWLPFFLMLIYLFF